MEETRMGINPSGTVYALVQWKVGVSNSLLPSDAVKVDFLGLT